MSTAEGNKQQQQEETKMTKHISAHQPPPRRGVEGIEIVTGGRWSRGGDGFAPFGPG